MVYLAHDMNVRCFKEFPFWNKRKCN